MTTSGPSPTSPAQDSPLKHEGFKWADPSKWDETATQYNDAAGRSSRFGAAHLLTLANSVSPFHSDPSTDSASSIDNANARAIDLGAGTGALTHQLAALAPDLPILATDISPRMLDELILLRTDPATSKITAQVVDMADVFGTVEPDPSRSVDKTHAGPPLTESSFTHVFSTMAIQVLPHPERPADIGSAEGGGGGSGSGRETVSVLTQWSRLLHPDGILAIAIWDFDEPCGPHAIWERAAQAVDPAYIAPPAIPPGHWTGRKHLEDGLRVAGFRDVRAEVREVGFDVGKEGFLRFFWESGNPMSVERRATFEATSRAAKEMKAGEALREVRREMERLLDEEFDQGRSIRLSVALAVGRRPE